MKKRNLLLFLTLKPPKKTFMDKKIDVNANVFKEAFNSVALHYRI